jgi:nicotinamidase-related amidase
VPALLLIDLQRGMCDADGPAGAGGLADAVDSMGALEAASRALDAARDSGLEVIHVRLAFDDAYSARTNRSARFSGHEEARRFLVGSRETEFRPEVEPLAGETVVNKGSVSPFASTPLLGSLLARGLDRVVVAGVATHLAVESAAREATDRGVDVTVLGDACAAPKPELHQHALDEGIASFATVTTVDSWIAGLDDAGDRK